VAPVPKAGQRARIFFGELANADLTLPAIFLHGNKECLSFYLM
jgi:hypothetical protein